MFKALNGERLLFLTRVCQVAWCSGGASQNRQNGVITPIQ